MGMTQIDQLQQQIVTDFTLIGNSFDQYAYLIELSAILTPLSEEKKTEDHLVKGCQSHVWLDARTEKGRFYFEGDSDTLILKGILTLLQDIFNGQPVEEVAVASIWFFDQTEITVTFDADRQKGIGYIISTLQKLAEYFCTQ